MRHLPRLWLDIGGDLRGINVMQIEQALPATPAREVGATTGAVRR